jgi:uncharacterized protein
MRRAGRQREDIMVRSGFVLASTVGAMMAVLVGTASAQSSQPPWCSEGGSKNAAERTICATRSLWNLDDTLNLSYAFAKDRLPAAEKRILESSQLNWLRGTRDACGSDVGCLAEAMRSRSATLDDINNRGHL